MIPKHVLIAILSLLSKFIHPTNRTSLLRKLMHHTASTQAIKPPSKLTSVPLAGYNSTSPQNSTFGVSVPCQSASDASIAGTAVAHQLLVTALQMAPPAKPNANSSDITTGISNALTAVTRALGFAGNLAANAAGKVAPKQQDLGMLDEALAVALVAVNMLVARERAGAGNVAAGNGTGAGSGEMIVGQIAVVSLNGPVVLSQER
jgi:hypothetical protein